MRAPCSEKEPLTSGASMTILLPYRQWLLPYRLSWWAWRRFPADPPQPSPAAFRCPQLAVLPVARPAAVVALLPFPSRGQRQNLPAKQNSHRKRDGKKQIAVIGIHYKDLFIGRDSGRCCVHRQECAHRRWIGHRQDKLAGQGQKRALPMDGSARYVLAHTTIRARGHAVLTRLLHIVNKLADVGIGRPLKAKHRPDRAIKAQLDHPAQWFKNMAGK